MKKHRRKDKDMDNQTIESLIETAMQARKMAYVPYSNFAVGAALLDGEGNTHAGCNIENAAFTPGICAERTAVSVAVSKGVRNFTAIAVVGGAANNQPADDCFPCGVCRQVLMEFCPPNFQIIIAQSPQNYRIFTLSELLPHGFGPDNLSN